MPMEEINGKRMYKEDVLKMSKGINNNEYLGKNMEGKGIVDLSQVVDLYDEDGIIDGIDPDNLVIEADEEEEK